MNSAAVMLEAPASEAAPVLLRVAGLAKHYGDQAVLADVSFDVQSGEILGLIGPNGAGKTTLLEGVAGLMACDGGKVLWREAPFPADQRKQSIFYVPDGARPYRDQPVARVLSWFADVHRRPATHVAAIIAAVGLAPVLHKRVDMLSKGYNRRLMLALGLIAPQPVLLMDEPFDGFDLKQSRDMMGVLRGVAATGRTLVLSIHQLNDAERICDRFVLLANGTVRGAGTLDHLRAETGLPAGHLEDVFLALT
jgi:ABC-2 type transport system ATP-binding protein